MGARGGGDGLGGVLRLTGGGGQPLTLELVPSALLHSEAAAAGAALAGSRGGFRASIATRAGSEAPGGGAAHAPLALSTAAPGTSRLQLLRLRSERPGLFRDFREALPLSDSDISSSAALRDILRSVPMPAVGAQPVSGTTWALATLVHSALGALAAQVGERGQAGSM